MEDREKIIKTFFWLFGTMAYLWFLIICIEHLPISFAIVGTLGMIGILFFDGLLGKLFNKYPVKIIGFYTIIAVFLMVDYGNYLTIS